MSQFDTQLFQSFSDAMPYGVCFVDLQGKIIYWNKAAETFTGYMGQEVLGRTYRGDLLVHCKDTSRCTEEQCPVAEVLHDGNAVMADLFLRHKDGHRVPVRVFAFPLRNDIGELKGVGEFFDPNQLSHEKPVWGGQSDREFEMATGLPAVEQSLEQMQTLLHSRSASSSALFLIEMTEQQLFLKHRGSAMLHQSKRVLAKTVAGLLPPRSFVGCWSNWRLIAIVPECGSEELEKLKLILAEVGSSCAVKWWGDRVTIRMRAAAMFLDASQSVAALIEELEQDLKSATDGKE
jgi:PAS domain S-box-containing protein